MGIAAMLLLGYGAGQMAPETALDGLMAFNRGNYSKARAIWSRLAAKEDAEALCNLGRMYEIGAGVKQDFEKAANLYRRAALKANPYALGNLGVLYATGHGVEQDLVGAQVLDAEQVLVTQCRQRSGNRGGLGSNIGALIGGAALGLLNAFASYLFGGEYQQTIAVGMLMIVLLIKPEGLLGAKNVRPV